MRRRMYVRGKRLQKGSTHRSSALQQRRTDGRRHTRETTETGACDYTARSCILYIYIIMKPTNSPTQGQPNPRENRLKAALGPLFFFSPGANNFSWVGIDFIRMGHTTRNPTQPKILRQYPVQKKYITALLLCTYSISFFLTYLAGHRPTL